MLRRCTVQCYVQGEPASAAPYHGEKAPVEEEHDAQQHEEQPEARQADADLLLVVHHGNCRAARADAVRRAAAVRRVCPRWALCLESRKCPPSNGKYEAPALSSLAFNCNLTARLHRPILGPNTQ